MKALKIAVLVLVLAAIYLVAATYATGLVWVPTPEWWKGFFGASTTTSLIWLFLSHSAAVFVGALVPGVILGLAKPQRWFWVGVAASAPFAYVLGRGLVYQLSADVPSTSLAHHLVYAGDWVVYLLAVPVIAWIVLRFQTPNKSQQEERR